MASRMFLRKHKINFFQIHAGVQLPLEPRESSVPGTRRGAAAFGTLCVFCHTKGCSPSLGNQGRQLVTMQKGFPLSSKQDYFNPCTKWNKVISLTSKYSLATESNGWKASSPVFNTKNVAARLNLPKGAIRKYMYLIHLSEEKMTWGSNVIFY